MLPDFPELKRTLDRRILAKFDAQRATTIHIFDKVHKFRVHEGKRLIIVREDGVESEVEMKLLSVESSITKDEYDTLTPDELAQKITQTGIEMGRKQLGLAYGDRSSRLRSATSLTHCYCWPKNSKVDGL